MGSGRIRDPLFTYILFTSAPQAHDPQEGVSEQAEREVAVPGLPAPHLVVIETDLPLCFRETILYCPAILADFDQFLDGRPLGAVGLVETEGVRVFGVTAEQQPSTHVLGRMGG